MRMYCPSLKKNVEATITDGKQVASKGGSLRNILYGEYEGRKCLPKTVKAEVFAQHGFAAESNFDKLSHEIAEEYEKKGKTPEEAQEIGDATAAKIGRMKYGKKGMERKSLKGKEAETISKDMTFNIDIEDASIENEDELEERGYSQDDIEQMREEITSKVDADRILDDIKSNHLDSIGSDTYYIEDEYGVYLKNRDEVVDDVEATIDYDVDAGGWSAETFEAYDDPISDRQEWKINSLGGTVDSSMNRSEASDYIKELQGRKSGTWKEAESSPSSFDISWEDAQGVSSPSLPPEGIHFAEGEDYNLNGENCDYCAEERELNAEGFCSECAHHADYFNARSYEDAFRSESVSYASEGLTRNGKFALGLTALGVGIAMAMGSEKVASLLDKINRK